MSEWGLLIIGLIYVVVNIIFPVVLTFMIDTFMHYGHIWGWIRWKHAESMVLKYEVEHLNTAYDAVIDSKTWHDKIDNANDLYWSIAATDKKMKMLICPICIGTRISILTCFSGGVAMSLFFELSLIFQVFLICCTPLFCIPFTVWLIAKKF